MYVCIMYKDNSNHVHRGIIMIIKKSVYNVVLPETYNTMSLVLLYKSLDKYSLLITHYNDIINVTSTYHKLDYLSE